MLKELKASGGANIQISINDQMEPLSEEAKQAEDRYGIRPVTVAHTAHGAFKREEVFLSAAFSCGLGTRNRAVLWARHAGRI